MLIVRPHRHLSINIVHIGRNGKKRLYRCYHIYWYEKETSAHTVHWVILRMRVYIRVYEYLASDDIVLKNQGVSLILHSRMDCSSRTFIIKYIVRRMISRSREIEALERFRLTLSRAEAISSVAIKLFVRYF